MNDSDSESEGLPKHQKLELFQKVTFVENQRHAGRKRSDAEKQVERLAVGAEIILQPPHAASEGQGAGSGDENQMKRLQ